MQCPKCGIYLVGGISVESHIAYAHKKHKPELEDKMTEFSHSKYLEEIKEYVKNISYGQYPTVWRDDAIKYLTYLLGRLDAAEKTAKKLGFEFTLDGKYYKTDKGASLFWDEVKITPPPRPKRKVKKTLDKWVNIYPSGAMGTLHNTERDADNQADTNFNRIGKAHHIIHEYEVEE